ncbi:stigma-specific STIG1-like protein 1 [Tasmannia lanceolata]|uniref:stigma-specific STIG1-like protein 1 n=1 Tax=Tasmannia lanceolata TaxID=3420 RepID=UPI00406446DD
MKMLSNLFVAALAMSLAITLTISATPIIEYPDPLAQNEMDSLKVGSRFLAQKKPGTSLACDKYPIICRTAGSPGPVCCKKQCVNVLKDPLNCGMCGKKCKYTETCCKGQCVNLSFDNKHCGSCNKRCNKGDYCVYGLCNYA